MLTSLFHFHDYIWSCLHAIILNIPPSRLALFPSLVGSVWFLTLASLLLTWVARGMRPYPGQSNPHVPFISDIASFELKPLFLVGASVTAMGFLFTVAAVHVMRYEPGFALVKCPDLSTYNESANSQNHRRSNDGDHEHASLNSNNYHEDEEDYNTTKTLKIISLFSILAAGLASTSLILLSVMDTFRYKFVHHIFLRLCFTGLALQSAGTAIVYADEVIGAVTYVCHLGRYHHMHVWGKRSLQVRILYAYPIYKVLTVASATLSTILILIEMFLGVALISLTMDEENSDYRAAGILEWVIAFLGTIYLWLFCGFFDRSDFEGYVPSVIYHPGTPPTLVVQPPTPCDESYDPNQDLEQCPLLRNNHNTERKYT